MYLVSHFFIVDSPSEAVGRKTHTTREGKKVFFFFFFFFLSRSFFGFELLTSLLSDMAAAGAFGFTSEHESLLRIEQAFCMSGSKGG